MPNYELLEIDNEISIITAIDDGDALYGAKQLIGLFDEERMSSFVFRKHGGVSLHKIEQNGKKSRIFPKRR